MSTWFYLSLTKLCQYTGLIDAYLPNSLHPDAFGRIFRRGFSCNFRLHHQGGIQKDSSDFKDSRRKIYKTTSFLSWIFKKRTIFRREISACAPIVSWLSDHLSQFIDSFWSLIGTKIPTLFISCSYYPVFHIFPYHLLSLMEFVYLLELEKQDELRKK